MQLWVRRYHRPQIMQAFVALAVLSHVSESMALTTTQSAVRWVAAQPWMAQPSRMVLEEEGEQDWYLAPARLTPASSPSPWSEAFFSRQLEKLSRL